MAYEDVEFFPFESSNVQDAGYDYNEGTLYVRFNNQYVYWYAGVPPQVWDAFMQSSSVGSYLHQNLKGQYEYGRVN